MTAIGQEKSALLGIPPVDGRDAASFLRELSMWAGCMICGAGSETGAKI